MRLLVRLPSIGGGFLALLLGSAACLAQTTPLTGYPQYNVKGGGIAKPNVNYCARADGTANADPCPTLGTPTNPAYVTVTNPGSGSGSSGSSTPTTAAGTASSSLVGVQGGGAGALPVAVTPSLPPGAATAAAQPALNGDGGSLEHITNFPVTQPVSAAALPLPAGAATAALQPTINADGGAQVHVMNTTATQPVSDTATATTATATRTNDTANNRTQTHDDVIAGAAGSLTGSAQSSGRLAVTPPDSFSFGGSVTSAAVVGSVLDTTGYGSIVVQVTSAGTGNTIVYEESNDPAFGTVTPAFGFVPGNALANPASSDSPGGSFARAFPVTLRYFRARLSTYGSGTFTILAYARTAPIPQYDPQTATRNVAAASLPLPAGASTAALQPAINADAGAQVHVMNLPATQPVSATALPLPAGASTAALQPAINADAGAQVHVMNLPATQAVSAAALPLPAGAATAALQPALTTPGTPAAQGLTATAVAPQVTYLPNLGGTITAASTSQQAASAGQLAHGCDLVNSSPSENLYFSFGAAATISTSVPGIGPGLAYHCPFGTSQTFNVIAATAGHPYILIGY